jgi:hypothetical protein
MCNSVGGSWMLDDGSRGEEGAEEDVKKGRNG